MIFNYSWVDNDNGPHGYVMTMIFNFLDSDDIGGSNRDYPTNL